MFLYIVVRTVYKIITGKSYGKQAKGVDSRLNIFIHVNLCEAQLLYSKWGERDRKSERRNLEGFLFEGLSSALPHS